jgi:hypothetical protein
LTRTLTRLIAGITLGVLLSAATAHAQSDEATRVGGGVSLERKGGFGASGGVLIPLKKIDEIRSLGIVGAGSLLHFTDGFGYVSFGGGLRYTRLLPNLSEMRQLRVYGQGLFGFAHNYDEGFSENTPGFTLGAGLGFKINDKWDGFAEADLARVTSPCCAAYGSVIFTFGVSTPIGE